MSQYLHEALQADIACINQALQEVFSSDDDYSVLFDAMRYSLEAGGKRVRPFLTLEFCRLFGGQKQTALPYACAVEMIHTYSLIHDDLPCMDNDDLRRGRPTNHIVFGEGVAMLAGDALLTHAFSIISSSGAPGIAQAVQLAAECAGPFGMIGGQQMDLIGETKAYSLDTLLKTYYLKTGKLIACACLLGVLAAGFSKDSAPYQAAEQYAFCIGTAFQVIDDILDQYGDEKQIGKTIGSDLQQSKSTFLTLMSQNEAFDYAKDLTEQAKATLVSFEQNEVLCAFADSLLHRIK
ncbi:MAG: polyprenyl synthetase family protein [Clostridiales bacterium]|nr:polyprenyl synthetase family protein [Clostridiales bacterium]